VMPVRCRASFRGFSRPASHGVALSGITLGLDPGCPGPYRHVSYLPGCSVLQSRHSIPVSPSGPQ
jgi:hypothetical protein